MIPLLLLPLASASLGQITIKSSIPAENTKQSVIDLPSTPRNLANFRIHLDYSAPTNATLKLGDTHNQSLPKGRHSLDLTYSRSGAAPALARSWIDGKLSRIREQTPREDPASYRSSDAALRLDRDFTVTLKFQSTGDGPLFSRTTKNRVWKPGSKALFIRGGNLVYDVHSVGLITRKKPVADNKEHEVIISSKEGIIDLWLDARRLSKPVRLHHGDDPYHLFGIGTGSPGFTKELRNGWVKELTFWDQAAERHGKLDAKSISPPGAKPALAWKSSTPEVTFSDQGIPGFPVKVSMSKIDGMELHQAWIQPLKKTDHATMIGSWSKQSLAEGKQIYSTLCATCHGIENKPGSMPTSRKLHSESFKNGNDPYRLFQTIRNGYALMPPMPQLSDEQTYSVIHYLREGILKTKNAKQYHPIDAAYLTSLPKSANSGETRKSRKSRRRSKAYEDMDFGPSLNWTYQLNPGARGNERNFAYKGISIRLDEGPGGISRGSSWAVYDQDTMRLATIYEGDFVDWRNIAFDGSHGTHTSIAGDPLFLLPDTPAWRHPTKQSWDDERFIGRDKIRYGPLPKDWVRYDGLYHHGSKTILSYRIGGASILEMPEAVSIGKGSLFLRHLNIAQSSHDLVTRIAPDSPDVHVKVSPMEGLEIKRDRGHLLLHVPAFRTPINLVIALSGDPIETKLRTPKSLELFTRGGPSRFSEVITNSGNLDDNEHPFALDEITIPNREENPWNSWMRIGGFDFFPRKPDRAAVCTWYGDVWIVDGVSGDLSELRWKRICTGLFQALGLRIVEGRIHVLCRDQLARLHDLNGDEEIDYIECFNNDHQVTEHFHEFAMGLQTDTDGFFYYAKSARHARPGLVAQHGTLLKVAPDGSKTEIVATGLRAANGVCIAPNERIFVTDQEGDWCPKNRINLIRPGKFYGNMLGYHDINDESDEAMEKPLVWMTNSFDRSPAEPVWIPAQAKWGKLNNHLLNLSYGYGQIHIVPFEEKQGQLQGAVCALPMKRAPTGLIRGRFHPTTHQLYAAGMTAWSSNCPEDGGFYRIRPTGKPSYLPIETHASPGKLAITYSDPLPKKGQFRVQTWDITRSRRYGSSHQNKRTLDITKAEIHGDILTLHLPGLAATRGMEIVCNFEGGIHRVIHATIHHLLDTDAESRILMPKSTGVSQD